MASMIRALPDTILCHILSFLETLHAVRTTVLSTRWNNIWTSVPNLDFNDGHKSFSSEGEDPFEVDGWVCTTARHNVIELDFHHCLDKPRTTFEFPQCIFMCKTLVVLKIFSNCTACSLPPSGCFPSLRFLHVTLHYPDNSVERLISCFPVLEDLTIDGTLRSLTSCVDFNFDIFAPELKTLTISLSIGCPTEPYYVFINAPKLEYIHLSQNTMAHYCFVNVKSLVKANIVLKAYQEQFIMLNIFCFRGCRHQYFLPEDLVLHDCSYWDLLPTVLQISQNLQHLNLEDANSPYGDSRDDMLRWQWQSIC
ncbi:hypothetical protein DVH24_027006 [Malus domestica]|uniref:F-box domain-containing protein n=1 Tax=Malus domestica TaxID=3750 RepID=A0A498IPW4_MALDO|nr:hypothetical protein DVH24_027006 [Malus domestica]